ncbi:MAG: DUF523 domain-containing protein [Clostridiales bacterium]|nr:DUF523 domain-containing protein [Clostridiales bacterium]
MANILVSACLLGIQCRYKGDGCPCEGIIALSQKHTLIPVCPEQLGGLATPRPPAERVGDRVMNREGADVTGAYTLGAEHAVRIAKLNNVRVAIMKAKSPSCGSGKVYDGTFSGRLVPGDGVCAEMLKAAGIKVYNEENYEDI